MNRAKTISSEQNGAGADRNARMEAEIGRILATEEKLIPSSGFAGSVMERVRQEAALPKPIPFPWTWAVAGILLVGGVFGWSVFEILRPELPALDILSLRALALPSPQVWVTLAGPVEEVGWVTMALVISLLCWLLSRRLAGSGGLL